MSREEQHPDWLVHVGARVDVSVRDYFDALALRLDRSRSWVIREVLLARMGASETEKGVEDK